MRQRVMIAIALVGRARDPGGRRADDRARRDGAGADPRGAGRAAAAPRDGGAADHARPRHRRRAGGSGGGDVRGADRGRGRRRPSSSPGPRIPTPRGCSPRSRASRGPVQRLTPDPRHRAAAQPRGPPAAGSGPAVRRRSTRASCRPSCCPVGPDHRMRCWLAEDGDAPRPVTGRLRSCQVRDLVKHYTARRPVPRRRAAGARGGRRVLRGRRAARRSRWSGESGLRQVVRRPHDPPAAGADLRARRCSRASTSSRSTGPRCGGSAAGCRSSSRIPTAASTPG